MYKACRAWKRSFFTKRPIHGGLQYSYVTVMSVLKHILRRDNFILFIVIHLDVSTVVVGQQITNEIELSVMYIVGEKLIFKNFICILYFFIYLYF